MAKGKQMQIPGTQRKVHPDVEEKANEVLENHLELRRLQLEKKTLLEELLVEMRRHNIKVYKFSDEDDLDDVTVTLEAETKVKVRKQPKGAKRPRPSGDAEAN